MLSTSRFSKLLSLALNPKTIKPLLLWPKFSLTSFEMLSSLVAQGIRPRTVIDVGANVGQFSVATAKLMPEARIYAFEPVADCVRQLRDNTRKLPQVTVFPTALGDHTDKLEIHVNSHAHSSSLLPLDQGHHDAFPDARETALEAVPVATLDGVADQLTLSSPCLLKIDVQGYEARVLAGGPHLLKQVDWVVMEVSFRSLYQGEILFLELLELMKPHGFRFLRPVGWLSDPQTGEILQMDALFERDGR